MVIRLAMVAVASALAYTTTLMLKGYGLSPQHRDFWIIVASSGLATLLCVQAVVMKGKTLKK